MDSMRRRVDECRRTKPQRCRAVAQVDLKICPTCNCRSRHICQPDEVFLATIAIQVEDERIVGTKRRIRVRGSLSSPFDAPVHSPPNFATTEERGAADVEAANAQTASK